MFRFTTIKDYHSDLLNGLTTCVEAVQHYLHTCSNQASLNAWLELFPEEALASAAVLDAERIAGKPLKPLHGVVIGIKDVLAYQGHSMSAASKILKEYTAVYNATAVDRLLEAGAIILGRQNCDEFAMGSSNEHSAFGAVRNALDTNRVPGGSSGGSAVAVQADMCMLSLGSDTGGSVRQPADFCGIIGMKPSYGRISRYGLIAYASSFDQIGIFAKQIEDVALALEVIAGEDAFDSTVSAQPVPAYSVEIESKSDQPMRLAYSPQMLQHPGLDPVIREGMEAFIKNLTAQGNSVESVDFELLEYIVPTYYILTTAEASSNLSRYDGVRFGHRSDVSTDDLTDLYKRSRSEGFGKEVKKRILLGTFVLSEGYFDAYFTKAQQVRRLLTNQVQSIFTQYDGFISPTVPSTAWAFGEKSQDPVEMYLADIYTVLANLVGCPAVSLPLFQHPNGLPYGLQLMTSPFSEVSLLRLSKKLLELGGK